MSEDRILEEVVPAQSQWSAQWMRDQALSIALTALGSRSLVWAAALGGGAVWTVTILHPDLLRIGASIGYCVTVLAPILIRDAKGAA